MAAAFLPRCILIGAAALAGACQGESAQTQAAIAAAADSPNAVASSPEQPAEPGDSDRPALIAPISPPDPSDCNADKAQAFVGREATDTVRAELTRAVAPTAAIRWVGPGTATTEDYSPQRLNVMLDAGSVIRSAHCG